MKTFFDQYYHFKSKNLIPDLPVLDKGLSIRVSIQMNHENTSPISYYHQYLTIKSIGINSLIAEFEEDFRLMKKGDIVEVPFYVIERVVGDWDYSLKNQYVLVHKSIIEEGDEVYSIRYDHEQPPKSYGMKLDTQLSCRKLHFDYFQLSLQEAVQRFPNTVESLMGKGWRYERRNGVFIELD